MAPPISERKEIAEDTIARSALITQEHIDQGASADSVFIAEQLPPLDGSKSPSCSPTEVTVVNADAFTVARNIISDDPEARRRTAVQNLASDEVRAGGWEESLWTTQVSRWFRL